MKVISSGILESGEPYTIRYPESTDAPLLHSYMNLLSEEKIQISFQGEVISSEEETEYLIQQLERIKNQTSVQLLIMLADEIIGVGAVDMGNGPTKHEGMLVITLKKEFRGMGIGTLFLSTLLDEAEKSLPDLKIVTLSVFEKNTTALKLYKNAGFKEYGRLPKGIYYKESYQDHIFMYKNTVNKAFS